MALPTVEIDLGEIDEAYAGCVAVVRERVSFKARQAIDNARQPRIVRGMDGVAREVTSDMWEFGATLLEHSLVSWSGVTDSYGNQIPATRKGLEHPDLDDALVDGLVARIEEVQAQAYRRTPAERKADVSALTGS